MFYHKLATCYRWMYRRCNLDGCKLGLNVTSIGLTVVGTIVGSVTLNPIVIGSLTGCGVLVAGIFGRRRS